jgi:hypothetical protein
MGILRGKPLMLAARYDGSLGVLAALVIAGADVNALSSDGKNARQVAGTPALEGIGLDLLF